MVNHRVHDLHPGNLEPINDHQPGATYNENTGDRRVNCSCGWISRAYRGRWSEKVDDQWGIHAADIAMRRKPTGEQLHVNCHCAVCARAQREAIDA